MKNSKDLIFGDVVNISIIIVSQILDFIYWTVTIFSFDHMTGETQELPYMIVIGVHIKQAHATERIHAFLGDKQNWG